MILMHIEQENRHSLLVVLEPGNIEKLKMGKPMIIDPAKYLDQAKTISGPLEFVIGFTPDAPFVTAEYRRTGDVMKALQDSLFRDEVFVPNPEATKRVR